MPQTIVFGPNDAGRCRFATSPLWETMSALRVLTEPRRHAYHLPWLDDVGGRLGELDLAPLLALSPKRGFTPDFLSPVPLGAHSGVEEQLTRLRATPLRQVEAEVARSLSDRDGEAVPPGVREQLADPRRARELLAELLEACWRLLVEPHWPRLKDLLDADVEHQSGVLADRGLEAMLSDLNPKVHWQQGVVRIDRRLDDECRLRGRGLVLMPSVFSWPDVVCVVDPPWQPTLVYPARGIAELWRPNRTKRSDALATLLGRTRAVVLASLHEPATTTALARRHELSPGTVSEHLRALHDAGLVARARRGHLVVYRQTRLGTQLAGQLGRR